VIPPQDLADILLYLIKTWDELRGEFPEEHNFDQLEPDLTLSLCERLNDIDRKFEQAVNASFSTEAYEPVRIGGKIVKNGRTDIKAVLGARGAPEVIIEFKKLSDGDYIRLYCSDGVYRFSSAKYSPKLIVGIMCGLVRGDRKALVEKLEKYLSSPKQISKFSCVPDASGGVVIKPSLVAPMVAEFDTVHVRPPGMSVGPITIAHMFLDCL
jgi:hypothetical protein